MTNSTQRVRYSLEYVAQAVEQIIDQAARWPEHHPHWTPEVRATWERYPAQVRAHRYPWLCLDPDRPIVEYLKTGIIGPLFVQPILLQE